MVNCSPDAVAENPNVGLELADELYGDVITVPYMAKFLVFAKRRDEKHGMLRVFVVTDDKLDKTLESHQRFLEVARTDDVEVPYGLPPSSLHSLTSFGLHISSAYLFFLKLCNYLAGYLFIYNRS